jgi:hypothetical protein
MVVAHWTSPRRSCYEKRVLVSGKGIDCRLWMRWTKPLTRVFLVSQGVSRERVAEERICNLENLV